VAVLAGSLLAAVVAVWLTTASSEFVWEALAPVLGKLQFPWRWQAIVGASVPLLLAVGWAVVAGKGGPAEGPRGWRRYGGAAAWAAAGAFFLAYSLLGLAVTPASGAQADITTRGMWAVDRQNGQVGASWTAEFLPNTVTEQRWAIGRAPGDGSSAAEAEPLAMAAVPQRLGYLGGTYAVDFGAPGRLILHQFAFPAWRVTVDGVPVAAQAEGALGLLAVDLPAGAHTVTVAWGATAAVWMGRVLTAAGWAFVLWVLAAQAGEERRGRRVGAGARGRAGAAWLAVAAWLGVGIVLVAGASGVTARSGVPQPVGADFGAVRLEAAEVHPARPGTVAQVRLHWAVEGPVEPLVAYVHVVDAAGAVVAQDDGPLGGEYTPAERWAPGLLLPHTHEVLLPADLAPGAYQVLAGVYRPGEAGAPLVAEGTGETRVPAGVLEVRP
jgi:hypothetical protein